MNLTVVFYTNVCLHGLPFIVVFELKGSLKISFLTFISSECKVYSATTTNDKKLIKWSESVINFCRCYALLRNELVGMSYIFNRN